jgi:hypothetical protein
MLSSTAAGGGLASDAPQLGHTRATPAKTLKNAPTQPHDSAPHSPFLDRTIYPHWPPFAACNAHTQQCPPKRTIQTHTHPNADRCPTGNRLTQVNGRWFSQGFGRGARSGGDLPSRHSRRPWEGLKNDPRRATRAIHGKAPGDRGLGSKHMTTALVNCKASPMGGSSSSCSSVPCLANRAQGGGWK